MPENAQEIIKEYQVLTKEMDDAKHHGETCEMMLVAKGLSMQQAGIITMETDAEVVIKRIQTLDIESLR